MMSTSEKSRRLSPTPQQKQEQEQEQDVNNNQKQSLPSNEGYMVPFPPYKRQSFEAAGTSRRSQLDPISTIIKGFTHEQSYQSK
jgi:hypothetical protein